MDERVVEAGKDVRNAEDDLALADLRSQRDLHLLLLDLVLAGSHCGGFCVQSGRVFGKLVTGN